MYAQPISVELVERDGEWQLLRGGKPFVVMGAGGEGSLAALKAAGGNTTRTWDAEDIDALLDDAHRHGIAVVVGIWLGHERHGFDYQNVDRVAEQYERARRLILKYKDHPAVLMWGIGNEMEGFEAGDNAAIWSAVNNIAELAHRIDPDHPTLTVTAEIGGDRVKSINRLCPAIDIHGINSYGGVASIPKRYRELGGKKPYLVTEYGPPGSWEGGSTSWNTPIELSSTQKAEFYRRAYRSLHSDASLSLGSLAFLWSWKVEATATWFGMFLPDGRRLAAV
ncbi:MAG: glycoside hydrolase family 2 TIM barrel-domain containing protein, partial [Myxococcota bacterium]